MPMSRTRPRIHALLVQVAPQGAALPPAPEEATLPEDGEAVPGGA